MMMMMMMRTDENNEHKEIFALLKICKTCRCFVHIWGGRAYANRMRKHSKAPASGAKQSKAKPK